MEVQSILEAQPPIFQDMFLPLLRYHQFNWTFNTSDQFNDSLTPLTKNLNITAKIAVGPDSKTRAMRIFVGVVELLVFTIGTPANCLVLYLIYEIFRHRTRNHLEGGGFQNGQLFVLVMTSFDLLFCFVHAPLMFIMLVLIEHFPLSYTACIVMYLVTHTTTTGSSLSLLALNVEKFIRLYKPLHYRSIVTRRRVVAASVLIWFISLSWGIFLMFGPFMTNRQTPKGQCYQTLEHHGVYVFFAAQFFVLPTLVSLAISGFTLLAALRTRRQRAGHSLVSSKPSTDNGVKKSSKNQALLENSDSKLHVAKRQSDGKKQKKNSCLSLMGFVGFVFTTTIWTSLTILPYRIGYLWTVMHQSSYDMVICMFALLALMVLNSAGNPFITIITKRQYLNRVKKMCRWMNSSSFGKTSSARNTEISAGAGGGGGGGGQGAAGSNVPLPREIRVVKLRQSGINGLC